MVTLVDTIAKVDEVTIFIPSSSFAPNDNSFDLDVLLVCHNYLTIDTISAATARINKTGPLFNIVYSSLALKRLGVNVFRL
tara:strand:- start:106 stop:348 length:243 start_codon:yes stop_codon:yes gene_type:complete